MIVFKSSGDDELWKNESGCHRVQRVPPTERKGRVHTSSITIAILPEITNKQISIKDQELIWKYVRGSGAGGQAKNKTSNAVQLQHIPSGMIIRCESGRSQYQNKESALELLRAKLWEQQRKSLTDERANNRKEQVGSGMRGDKRRTVAHQRGEVIDHVSGKTWKLKNYLRGDWNE